jgi:hypothetical protein
MAGRQYGFLGNKSGFMGGAFLFCAPVDVLSVGEKTPFPALFDPGLVITECYLHVLTAEATAVTKKIDIGLLSSATAPDADADGFAVQLDTNTAGVIRPTLVPTATLGALLKELSTGGTVHVPRSWVISKTNTTLSYTLASAHTELVADIYLRGFKIPVPNT